MSKIMEMKVDNKALSTLIKAFKKIPTVKVGVLATGDDRRDGETSNATIGAKHEFGESGMPMRSFLRMPLSLKLDKSLEKSGLFNEDLIKDIIRDKELEKFMNAIGATAQSVILDAFDTGGFGKWQPSNMRYKKNKQTLIETQQLMRSIDWELIK